MTELLVGFFVLFLRLIARADLSKYGEHEVRLIPLDFLAAIETPRDDETFDYVSIHQYSTENLFAKREPFAPVPMIEWIDIFKCAVSGKYIHSVGPNPNYPNAVCKPMTSDGPILASYFVSRFDAFFKNSPNMFAELGKGTLYATGAGVSGAAAFLTGIFAVVCTGAGELEGTLIFGSIASSCASGAAYCGYQSGQSYSNVPDAFVFHYGKTSLDEVVAAALQKNGRVQTITVDNLEYWAAYHSLKKYLREIEKPVPVVEQPSFRPAFR